MSTPMICGGVYEWTDSANRVMQGTLVSITTKPSGEQSGTMLATGFAPELVQGGSERWEQFRLIGRPASPSVGRPKKKG